VVAALGATIMLGPTHTKVEMVLSYLLQEILALAVNHHD